MKTKTFYFFSFLFSFFFYTSKANLNDSIKKTEVDSSVCLEISGRILKSGKTKDDIYTVELIKDNLVIEAAIKKDKKPFAFVLKKDTYYAIRIIKEGYAPKLISIYTGIPDTKYEAEFYSFSFKAELIEETEFEKLDQDSQDFPIAIISFDRQKKAFDYNEKYTGNIKKSLYKTNAYAQH